MCPIQGLQNGPPRLEGKATNPPKVEHAFLSRQRERLEASCVDVWRCVVTFFALESWGLIQKSDIVLMKILGTTVNNIIYDNLCIKISYGCEIV